LLHRPKPVGPLRVVGARDRAGGRVEIAEIASEAGDVIERAAGNVAARGSAGAVIERAAANSATTTATARALAGLGVVLGKLRAALTTLPALPLRAALSPTLAGLAALTATALPRLLAVVAGLVGILSAGASIVLGKITGLIAATLASLASLGAAALTGLLTATAGLAGILTVRILIVLGQFVGLSAGSVLAALARLPAALATLAALRVATLALTGLLPIFTSGTRLLAVGILIVLGKLAVGILAAGTAATICPLSLRRVIAATGAR
jgi:hypothetical protein